MTDKRKRDTAFEKFTWRIENFSKLKSKKLYSVTFIISGYTWRILIFPKGNDVEYLSIYLDAVDCATLPEGWKIFARFKFVLIDQVYSKMDITRDTEHQLCAKQSDWGYTSFVRLTEFHDPVRYLLEDTCIIVAEVSVNEPANEIIVNQATTITTPLKSDAQVGVMVVEIPQEEDQGRGVTLVAPSSQVHTEPIKTVDFRVLGQMEEAFLPLLEEVCLQHPSLIECQQKHTLIFSEWAFIPLGRVLHFLKTKKIRDMNDDDCKNLQVLWDELKKFGFDLNWLEPRVQSALSMKTYLERAEEVKSLKENVASLEMKMKSLKANITVVEIDLEIARKDLAIVAEGFERKMLMN